MTEPTPTWTIGDAELADPDVLRYDRLDALLGARDAKHIRFTELLISDKLRLIARLDELTKCYRRLAGAYTDNSKALAALLEPAERASDLLREMENRE